MRNLLARYFLERMLGGGHRHRRGYGRHGFGRHGFGHRPRHGYGHRRHRSSGGIFPIPHYTRHTRGGTRVTFGGCCLPLALTFVAVPAAAVRFALRR